MRRRSGAIKHWVPVQQRTTPELGCSRVPALFKNAASRKYPTCGVLRRARDTMPRLAPSVRRVELGGGKRVGPVAGLAGDGEHHVLRHVVAFAAGAARPTIPPPLARARGRGL